MAEQFRLPDSARPADEAPAELNPDQVAEAAYGLAAQEMINGRADAEIEAMLVEKGLSMDDAAGVVANLRYHRDEAVRKAGQKNMLFGALWAGGGLLVTILTMQAAQGGGTYVVAWGAVIFGAIQFIQGVVQVSSLK